MDRKTRPGTTPPARTGPPPQRRPVPAAEGGRATGSDEASVAQSPLVPLRSGPGAVLIAATVLASMVGFLDASVVNVADPGIARHPGATLPALPWRPAGYPLPAAAAPLGAGGAGGHH